MVLYIYGPYDERIRNRGGGGLIIDILYDVYKKRITHFIANLNSLLIASYVIYQLSILKLYSSYKTSRI